MGDSSKSPVSLLPKHSEAESRLITYATHRNSFLSIYPSLYFSLAQSRISEILLPEECKMLSESLQQWREEVDALSSSRSSKPIGDRRPDVGRNARRGPEASYSLSPLPKTWIYLSDSSQHLINRLNSFAYAMYYVSELQHPQCTHGIRELVQTLSRTTRPDLLLARIYFNLFISDWMFAETTQVNRRLSELSRVTNRQKMDFERLANVTQVSTFFAAVVASTLQFSLSDNAQLSNKIINALWLGSLVLSIGSALNSFLAGVMLKVISLTPMSQQPFYVTFWIQRSHSALLVVAVICYSVGLGIFVFKTQPLLVAISTTIIGSYCAVGLTTIAGCYVKDNLNVLMWWQQVESKEGEETSDISTLLRHFYVSNMPSGAKMGRIPEEEETAGSSGDLEAGRKPDPTTSARSKEPVTVTLAEVPKGGSQFGDGPSLQWLFRSMMGERALGHQSSQLQLSGSGQQQRHRPSFSRTQSGSMYTAQGTQSYIGSLGDFKQTASIDLGDELNSLCSWSDELGAKILHMRISSLGRWLVVCHREACVVYDVERVVLRAVPSDPHHPYEVAEHAAWAPQSPADTNSSALLLTRTSSRVRLWEISEMQSGDGVSATLCRQYVFGQHHLPKSHFKYIRWLNPEDTWKARITDVHPFGMGERASQVLICISKKTVGVEHLDVENSQGTTHRDEDGPGVDYLLVLDKRASDVMMEYFWKVTRAVVPGAVTSAQMQTADSRFHYEPTQNVRSLKFCKEFRFMLVNYDEIQHLENAPPELWLVKVDIKHGLMAHPDEGSVARLPMPGLGIRGDAKTNPNPRWGDASFTGPNDDLIVCDVDGEIKFYRFDRNKILGTGPPGSALKIDLQPLKESMPQPNFKDFYHPVYTWGETSPRPLMVTTDVSGLGKLCVWTVPKDHNENAGDDTKMNNEKGLYESDGHGEIEIVATT